MSLAVSVAVAVAAAVTAVHVEGVKGTEVALLYIGRDTAAHIVVSLLLHVSRVVGVKRVGGHGIRGGMSGWGRL